MIDRLSGIDRELGLQIPAPPGETRTAIRSSGRASKHAPVVEDDVNERTLLAGYLRLCGFEVSEAGDGVEAMEFLDRQVVDLVVLDVWMPRMNGVDTVKAIRKHRSLKETKVVIVSGEPRDELMVSSDCRGVSEWFSKPLDPDRRVRHLDALSN